MTSRADITTMPGMAALRHSPAYAKEFSKIRAWFDDKVYEIQAEYGDTPDEMGKQLDRLHNEYDEKIRALADKHLKESQLHESEIIRNMWDSMEGLLIPKLEEIKRKVQWFFQNPQYIKLERDKVETLAIKRKDELATPPPNEGLMDYVLWPVKLPLKGLKWMWDRLIVGLFLKKHFEYLGEQIWKGIVQRRNPEADPNTFNVGSFTKERFMSLFYAVVLLSCVGTILSLPYIPFIGPALMFVVDKTTSVIAEYIDDFLVMYTF